MGERKANDSFEGDSDLSDIAKNEWAEIMKYEQEKYQEDRLKAQ